MSRVILYAQRYREGLATVCSEVVKKDGLRLCEFLEDELRGWGEKVYGETCIPPGLYQINPLHETPMAKRYYKRFPGWFRGLPELQWVGAGPMVPLFTSLRIHPGIDKEDTLGCPLTASSTKLGLDGDYRAVGTVVAFQRFCLFLYEAWDRVADTYLEISNHRIAL